jgi:hypothetical protein
VGWQALGGSGELLCSHCMPLDILRELIGHLFAPRLHFGKAWKALGFSLESLDLLLGAEASKILTLSDQADFKIC